MKKGYLSDYFVAVVAKRLSAVEADGLKSHQHEFNGIKEFKAMLGSDKKTYNATFLYLSDNENKNSSAHGNLTWYDARANHPTRSEYRLYYQSVSIFNEVSEQDMLLICKSSKNTLYAIIAESQSTIEKQLCWLFNIEDRRLNIAIDFHSYEKGTSTRLNIVGKYILEELGIDITDSLVEDNCLAGLLKAFPSGFPGTDVFSMYARKASETTSSLGHPDTTVIQWMEYEEILFRTMEKHMIDTRLETGFNDADHFLAFSLSVHNRRKSRAGRAFENHLKQVLTDHAVEFSFNKKTELKSRPDFLFPGIKEYKDMTFPAHRLFMLAVKTTCKDRWRQILVEAQRISRKHLITLEPSISPDQTSEMQSKNVQLVIPTPIQPTYTQQQQPDLISLSDFISMVK